MSSSDPSGEAFEAAVAAGDPDRMAAAFFASAEARKRLMILYAFNLELARVKGLVREPMAGHLRLAWWREQLQRAAAGAKAEVPALQALAPLIPAYHLPTELLLGLIDARTEELNECPFATIDALEAHAQATAGALMKLSARLCGAGAMADAIAGPAGNAFALVGVLRSLPVDASQRHCYLPLDLLARAGIGPEDVFAGDEARIAPVVAQVLGRAEEAVLKARRQAIPAGAAAAILPAVLARQHIPLLRAQAHHAFTPGPPLPRLTAAAALSWAAWTRRI